MSCEHKRIKSVNCVLICCDCGAVLPPETLSTGNNTTAAEKPSETPKKAPKRKATPKA